jgi:hypothetical protein
VPAKLVAPHEVTLWAEQRLKEASKDAYGRLEVGGRYHPDLCMQPDTVKRALLLLDTVAKALVERGVESGDRATPSDVVAGDLRSGEW